MQNLEKIPYYTSLAPRVQSWFNPTILVPQKLRIVILGTIASGVISEVTAYKLLKQNVVAGELNVFAIDSVIISLSLLTSFLGPVVAWCGYNNRRGLMVAWNIGVGILVLTWFAMPSAGDREESEYCHGNNYIFRGITATPMAAVRLSLLILTCVVSSLTKIAVWSHGIAHIEEHAPARTSMHFGILVTTYVLLMVVGYKTLTSAVETNFTFQILGLFGNTLGNIVQTFLFVPKNLTPSEEDPLISGPKNSFFASINRILQNTVAMSQMVAIGLLAAALWGFGYHESELVKVLYHINIRDGSEESMMQVLKYLIVIMSVLYCGVKFSVPILSEFCKYRGIKQATIMSAIALIFYILLMTIGKCEKGHVAGLENSHYNFPNCSSSCGCIPRWSEFSPVCVVDQMTTYVSPCQAGCTSSELLNNIRVYTNCSCAPENGRAIMGACTLSDCYQSYQLHVTLFIIVTTVTVLAFQAQGMILLRSVQNRDKSVALGVAGSVVSMLTFVCGHLMYLGISTATCRWFQEGRCHLQSQMFPIFVGTSSAVLVFLSIIISVTNWISWKIADRNFKKNDDLDIPEEQIFLEQR